MTHISVSSFPGCNTHLGRLNDGLLQLLPWYYSTRTNVLFVLLTPQSRLTFSAPYVSSASRAATLSKHTSNAAHAVPAMK